MIIEIFEFLFFFLLFIILFLISIYYLSIFFEGRLKIMNQFLNLLSFLNLSFTLFLPFVGFSIFLATFSFISNGLWIIIHLSGFPFISLSRPDFIIAIILSVFNQAIWLLHFLGTNNTIFIRLSFFFFFIWIIPLTLLVSISSLENDKVTEQMNSKGSSYKLLVFDFIKNFKENKNKND